jgi:hypothetical protein
LGRALVMAAVSAVVGCNDFIVDVTRGDAGISTDAGGGLGDAGRRQDGGLSEDGGTIPDAGCAADLTADPRNCGRCGQDCLNGGCSGGQCLPFVLAKAPAVGGAISAEGLEIGSGYVYLSYANGGVFYVPLDGGSSFVRTGPGSNCGPLLNVSNFLYQSCIAPPGHINRYPADGTSAGNSWLNAGPWGLVTDGQYIYLTNWPDGLTYTPTSGAPSNGSYTRDPYLSPQCIPSNISCHAPHAVAIDLINLYWSDDITGNIFFARRATPPVTSYLITTMPGSVELATHNRYLYWTDKAVDGGIWRWQPDGGSAAVAVARRQPQPFGIAVDDGGVYWSNGDGSLRRLAFPLDGGVEVIASGLGAAGVVKLTPAAIYWVSPGNAQVVRLAR